MTNSPVENKWPRIWVVKAKRSLGQELIAHTKPCGSAYGTPMEYVHLAEHQAEKERLEAELAGLKAILAPSGFMSMQEKMEILIKLGPAHDLKVELAQEVLRNIREALRAGEEVK